MIKSSFNALSICRNPYQGGAKKVLCICFVGLERSPTIANVLHREYGYNTRACGSSIQYALVPVSEVLLEWADEIVFADTENEDEVRTDPAAASILDRKDTQCLDLPDEYEWNDPTLIRIIKERYK